LDLKNNVDALAFFVMSHGAALHEQAKEIKKLRHKLSEHEKVIFKLCRKGMYAFVYVCGRVKTVDCRLLQYDILLVKMFRSLDILISTLLYQPSKFSSLWN
jgi:hypothetical protein